MYFKIGNIFFTSSVYKTYSKIKLSISLYHTCNIIALLTVFNIINERVNKYIIIRNI